MNYRRYYIPDASVFIVGVTKDRISYFTDKEYIELFRMMLKKTSEKYPFELPALVILPDHFHLLTETNGNDLSGLTKKMKLSYSTNYRKLYKIKSGRIWQYRFYDHIIRNQEDLNNHIDYIHYNPVKHGFVKNPFRWQYSSIKKYRENYGKDWGINEKPVFTGNYGE